MLLIREIRKELVSIREFLKCSLGPLPWALATADGGLRKTAKSQLLKCLKPCTRSLDEVPPHSVQIFVGMVILQQLPPELASFGHISDHILHGLTIEQSRIIFFVIDRFVPSSIKSNEREVRGNFWTSWLESAKAVQKTTCRWKEQDQPCQISFEGLVFTWKTYFMQDKMLFFTVKEERYKLTSCDGEVKKETVEELCSSQEEADTKMFLCA